MMRLKAEPLGNTHCTTGLGASMNPVVQPPVIYTGSLNGGFSQPPETATSSTSLLGDFVARVSSSAYRSSVATCTVRTRQIARKNSRGTIKLDFS
jgi:hypothetical protein